jgi:hypothetical protein
MNPSASGVFFFVVAGVKYDAMLRTVSRVTGSSIWRPDITGCACNPSAARITELRVNTNALHLISIVDLLIIFSLAAFLFSYILYVEANLNQ